MGEPNAEPTDGPTSVVGPVSISEEARDGFIGRRDLEAS